MDRVAAAAGGGRCRGGRYGGGGNVAAVTAGGRGGNAGISVAKWAVPLQYKVVLTEQIATVEKVKGFKQGKHVRNTVSTTRQTSPTADFLASCPAMSALHPQPVNSQRGAS